MRTPPRFSVVTIVLNGRDYLVDAVASIREQTLEDWELHIVDDGSTDGTLDIASDLVADDPERIHLHRHPGGENRGMSISRNLGLHHATGEFVTWLDHDDRFLPTKLETLHDALDRHPEAVAAIGPCRRWWSWSDSAHSDTDQSFQAEPFDVLLPPPGLVPVFIQHRESVPLGPLVRRVPLVSMGGHVDSFRGMHEDQAFLARIMFRHPIVLIPEILHLYRQHRTSCVRTTHHSGRDLEARRRFLLWLTDEFETTGTREESLRNQIRRALAETRGWRIRKWRRWLINARARKNLP